MGRADSSGEIEGLFDRERRKMDIVFWTELDVPSIVLGNLRRRQGVVRDRAVRSMIVVAVIGDSFEESRATRTRISKDHWKSSRDVERKAKKTLTKHFSWLDHTLEPRENSL